MSTSIFNGTFLYDPADVGADRFCHTAIIRDGVVNSALHKGDSAAQPRGIWCAPVASLRVEDGDPFSVPSSDQAGLTLRLNTYYHFGFAAVYCPKVRASGKGYRLRITIGGRSSGGDDCDFVVIVSPYGSSAFSSWGVLETSWPQKAYSNVTSTTIALLTPDDGDRILDVEQDIIDQALEGSTWSTFTDTGGDAIAVQIPLLNIGVVGRTSDAGSVPELHLFAFQEVIGT